MTLKLDPKCIHKQAKGESTRDDNLVTDAVEFLSHDKVKGTSLRRRILFLKSKGLNTDQIFTAFAHAGQTIERQRIEEVEPGIAITSIRASVPAPSVGRKMTFRHYLTLGGLSFFSAIGAYHLLQRLMPYEIHIRRKKATETDRSEDRLKSQSDTSSNAKLRVDLAKLHSDLARSRAETRVHLQHIDKLLLDKQQLESEIGSLRHANGDKDILERHDEEEESEVTDE